MDIPRLLGLPQPLVLHALAVLLARLLPCISAQEQNQANSLGTLRWCVISDAEHSKCEAMRRAFIFKGLRPEIACVRSMEGKFGCMDKIDHYDADIMSVDSGDMYIAGQEHSMVPLMREKYGRGSSDYAVVAVVKRGSAIQSLRDLRNKKACFTGVGRMDSWNVPLAILIQRKIMDVEDCNNQVVTAEKFFGSMCAPNALSDQWNYAGTNPSGACDLCGDGPNSRDFCTDNDAYAGYSGALLCLVSGGGDVAFMNHLAPLHLTEDQIQAGARAQDFELLCLDGSRAPLDQHSRCNWGVVPPHALMVLSDKTPAETRDIQALLFEAQKYFGARTSTPTTAPDKPENFRMFSSELYGGSGHNLLFQDSTTELEPVTIRNIREYMGPRFENVTTTLRFCPIHSVRWCVVTPPEEDKCARMSRAFLAKHLQPEMICVHARSQRQCMEMINKNEADLITLDGGEGFEAGEYFGLRPIAYEDLGDDGTFYYSVAVVKKVDKTTTILRLKGKNACFSGIGKGAGWIAPISQLIAMDQIRLPDDWEPCDVAPAVSEFFAKSCLPGALTYEYNTGESRRNLCTLCFGQGRHLCARNQQEPFYGDTGALRCLVEGQGDVAFMKHTTVRENTDGRNPLLWSRGLIPEDFELLCKDDTLKPVSEYKTCNLGSIPASAIYTAASRPQREVQMFWNLLHYGQQYFSTAIGERFKMFESTNPDFKDLMFDDATQKLIRLPPRTSWKGFLDFEYRKSAEAIQCVNAASRRTLSSPFFLLTFYAIFFTFFIFFDIFLTFSTFS